jgi:putative phosphoribosyl transferase
MFTKRFENRIDAGRALAAKMPHVPADALVLALPRGGVPVAAEVARHVGCELDVVVSRKLGVPWQRELAMGAICEDGVRVTNDDVVSQMSITDDQLWEAERRERQIVADRARTYRQGRGVPAVQGRFVVIVDDGIATGATAKAACLFARMNGARHVTLAVPVAPSGWEHEFAKFADECVSVATPDFFGAVGNWYHDFSEVTDGDVVRILGEFGEHEIRSSFVVRIDPFTALDADVVVPPAAVGCVVFVHGSGSSRMSPRNRHVAEVLNEGRLATVLFDLLTEEEAHASENVFNVEMLSTRLLAVLEWVGRQEWARGLSVGLFGASTGAAAALSAAARQPRRVATVVSRGGRPDMADGELAHVRCPVLLIVGSRDTTVLRLNRDAERRLAGSHTLLEVRGATHLFEEPGTLDLVAERARDWFLQHLHAQMAMAGG